MRVKCKIKVGSKFGPKGGTVKAVGQSYTGTCPECLTPGIPLSVVGYYIRAHVVSATELPENNPQPATMVAPVGKKAGKGLSETQMDLTDAGLRIGDPREAAQRRMADVQGATQTGTVKVPRRVQGNGTLKDGSPRMVTKMVEVPATAEHVREALDYWKGRKVTQRTSDAMRQKQSVMISDLSRRLGALSTVEAPRYNKVTGQYDTERKPVTSLIVDTITGTGDGVRVNPESQHRAQLDDSAQGHRGPTLVPGRPTAPRVREPGLSWDEPTDLRRDGTVRMRTTVDEPRGRDRFDRSITEVPEPKRKRTAAERRRYRAEQTAIRLAARKQSGE